MPANISSQTKREGAEILITGMSGKFPKSNNVKEFSDNLYNKVDLMSDATERFTIRHPSMPQSLGLCSNMEYFDAQFFAVNYRQASHFEPIARKLLEVACEAIIDAGINPRSLRNTKTGVFIGTGIIDCEAKSCCGDAKHSANGYSLTGTARTMMANRISYWLGARGPSYTVFGECSSNGIALSHAYHALETGQCEAAIVGGGNLNSEPTVALQINWLNYSSPGSKTKCFSEDADGSIRSDAVAAIFLQKAKDSKRVYAQLVYAKAKHMGLEINDQYYLHPSGDKLYKLLTECYSEINVKPEDVEYIEACGTALKKADYEELQNIDKVFCSGRRSKPIMVGSVKSNVGNTESAAVLLSFIKVLLAYNRGEIAANLNLENPRKDIKAINEGRIRLVDENIKFERGYAAITSYSYAGICAHFLLKAYNLDEHKIKQKADIPYLVCISGRIEHSIENLFEDLESKPLDDGQISLLHNAYDIEIPGFIIRGYNVLTTENNKTVSLFKRIDNHDGRQRPVWFVYSGMGSQWPSMGAQLMRLPIFAQTINRLHEIMEPYGVDLINILTNPNENTFDNILNSFVGIAAIQIALTDVLRAIDIVPDYIIGHSVGELGCAYADGCLSAEEMILSAYYRGLVSIKTSFIKGAMAAVGLGYNAIKSMCPPEIVIACHNGPESCTLSGPVDAMKEFVTKLKAQGIFAKEVACSNIAYHSKYIAEAGPALLKYMSKVIKDPKARSQKWISSSVPQNCWDEPHAKLCSAEYLTNNLLNPVLFEEASKLIADYAITIEIAPHGLLQAILKRSLPGNCVHRSLTRRGHSDNVALLLESIGELYMHGLKVQPKNLYPSVKWPVSCQTPLLSHTLAWEHSEIWPTFFDAKLISNVSGERRVVLTKYDEDLAYLKGYVTNGFNTLPAAAQLVLVWETLGIIKGMPYQDIAVIFKNVRFDSDVVIPDESSLELVITLQRSSGNFEITLQNATITSGQVVAVTHVYDQHKLLKEPTGDVMLNKTDIYRILTHKGYNLSGEFKSIQSMDSSFSTAEIAWNNNWVTFMDSLIQMTVLNKQFDTVSKPKFIDSLEINVKLHKMAVADCKVEEKLIKAYNYKTNNICSCAGVNLGNVVTREEVQPKPMLQNPTVGNVFDNFKLQVGRPGDFDSLTWVQEAVPKGDLRNMVRVHYARLAHTDLLLAQGKQFDEQTREFGTSFSGVDSSGIRLMGVVKEGAMSGIVEMDELLTWTVPDHWTMDEAATVPLAYVQALYILIQRAELKPNSTVLVTQGSSPLGLAIISACLNLKCEVFTTLRNKTHKAMLMKLFPELKEEHICMSRDNEVVEAVLKGTNCRGCDIVISSVDGCERQMLMSTVGAFGSFIDVNVKDMQENETFGMAFLFQSRCYKAVKLNGLFLDCNYEFRKKLKYAIHKGITEGWVQPLPHVTYQPDMVTRAMQLLNCKRSFGAVLMNLTYKVKAVSQWKCDDSKSYIIVCDNDFGVEMIGKLLQLRAKNIVVHSKNMSNYFRFILSTLPHANIVLSNEDLSSKIGCKRLLASAQKLGPISALFIIKPLVGGNVAFDGIVKNLDYATRNVDLSNFVIIIPSVSVNEIDAFSNICLQRVESGLSGRIIHCNVEHNENYEAVELLTVPLARIIKSLDVTMIANEQIVTIGQDVNKYELGITDIIHVLGLSQTNTICMSSALTELGVQMSTAILLSNALKHYNCIYFRPQMLLNMTLKQITEHHSDLTLLPTPTSNPFGEFFSFYDNDYEHTSSVSTVWMPTVTGYDDKSFSCFEQHGGKDYMIVLPGMEGLQYSMSRVCRRLKMRALLYQYIDLTHDTVQEMAHFIVKDITRRIGIGSTFYILGYSFGVLLALEMAAILEKEGIQGKVFCLDAGPKSLKIMLERQTSCLSMDEQQNLLLLHTCQLLLPHKNLDELKRVLVAKEWDLKVIYAMRYLTYDNCHYLELTKTLLNLAWKRINQVRNYQISFHKLNSDIILLKGSDSDYGLKEICDGDFKIYNLDCEHKMIPYNLRISNIVNREINIDLYPSDNLTMSS